MQKRHNTPDSQKSEAKGTTTRLTALAFELGFLIATPLVILGVIGRLLDKQLDAAPFFLITAIVLSLPISGVSVYRKIRDVIE